MIENPSTKSNHWISGSVHVLYNNTVTFRDYGLSHGITHLLSWQSNVFVMLLMVSDLNNPPCFHQNGCHAFTFDLKKHHGKDRQLQTAIIVRCAPMGLSTNL
eukprot:216693_1